jgi:hypothetical protein
LLGGRGLYVGLAGKPRQCVPRPVSAQLLLPEQLWLFFGAVVRLHFGAVLWLFVGAVVCGACCGRAFVCGTGCSGCSG